MNRQKRMATSSKPIGNVEETKAILVVALNFLEKYYNEGDKMYLNGAGNVLNGYLHALETGERVPLQIAEMLDVMLAESQQLQ